ncbi:hypothetical protein F5X97DRAFT_296628 [Nemania serpens]|nr:hypothetical protein F5X97DRAFT_296628 [Nemania serpens]
MTMPSGRSKKPKYYRDKGWKPPYDLLIPSNCFLQCAFPAQGYHLLPSYQPMATPSQVLLMLPAPSSTASPAAMIQPSMMMQPSPMIHPATIQASAVMHPSTMAQPHAMMLPTAMAQPSAMLPIPQAPQYYAAGQALGPFAPPRY